MLRDLLSKIWRHVPAALRRWSVRATNTKFTVTAAGIVRNNQGKVLLIKHRFRPGSGWGIPGGFLEAGEQADAALRRELCEEIGLELEQVRIYASRTFRRQNQIEVVFLANASGQPHHRRLQRGRGGEWRRIRPGCAFERRVENHSRARGLVRRQALTRERASPIIPTRIMPARRTPWLRRT